MLECCELSFRIAFFVGIPKGFFDGRLEFFVLAEYLLGLVLLLLGSVSMIKVVSKGRFELFQGIASQTVGCEDYLGEFVAEVILVIKEVCLKLGQESTKSSFRAVIRLRFIELDLAWLD